MKGLLYMNQDPIEKTLFEALEKAGNLLREALPRRAGFERKSELSLVTETDRQAEKVIIETIFRSFPNHAILAEESLGQGNSPKRWIIDPLDGTTNFAHTYPVACVSIAYEENGVLEYGGVFDPFRQELFYGRRGKGAFLNGHPLRVSENSRLADSLLATGFPYDRKKNIDSYVGILRDFLMHIHGVRRTGSAATDICYVACGRFDGYWEAKLNPWDVAAAALILMEAGGHLTDYAGGAFSVDARQTVASNGKIHAEMLEVLKPHRKVGLD